MTLAAGGSGQFHLFLGNGVPNFGLVLGGANGSVQLFARDSALGYREEEGVLACPAAPAPLLNAESGDGDFSGMGGDDEVRAKRAILASAFDDVAGLDEEIDVAKIFDEELVDVGRFVKKGGSFFQAFLDDGIVGKRRFLGGC